MTRKQSGAVEDVAIAAPEEATGTPRRRSNAQTMRDRHGQDYFRRIGKQGGQAVRDQLGLEHYAALGRVGGANTRDAQDANYYRRIGRIGGQNGRGVHRPHNGPQASDPGPRPSEP
jgi:hypothetical protein